MNGLKILTGYVIICVSFMYTVLRAEMSSQRKAQDPMTMRNADWKAGLVIICSFARPQMEKMFFSL